MAVAGYKRVSTEDQSTDRQDLGDCDKVFEEKVSGGSTSKRQALAALIDWARDGDEVRVYSIDRLARNLTDLQEIIGRLRDKGVTVSFLKERLVFSPSKDDPASTFYLQVLGAVAQFERAIIRERQREGIAKAKAKGVYKGRKPSVDAAKVVQMSNEGVKAGDIAKALKISRMSVYRALATVSD